MKIYKITVEVSPVLNPITRYFHGIPSVDDLIYPVHSADDREQLQQFLQTADIPKLCQWAHSGAARNQLSVLVDTIDVIDVNKEA
jgi:hypothetical protein